MNTENLDDYLTQLSPQQQQNWHERKFMLKHRVKAEARPQLCYSVTCKTCHKEHFVRSVRRAPLSEKAINVLLILEGWIFGPAGYECPACQVAWAQAVVAYVDGMVYGQKEIEGTAVPVYTKQQIFERIGELAEHVSVDYHPETQTLKLAEVGVLRPISGQFQLDSQTGINGACDWLGCVQAHLNSR